MTPSVLLSALAPGSPAREEAGRALLRLLETLIDGSLREPRSGQVFLVPPEHRPEVIASVALKVVERSPLPVAGKSDDECRAYLRTMMVRLWISMNRGKREQPLGEDLSAERSSAGPEPLPAEGLQRLEQLVAELAETKLERHRAGIRNSWAQILELTFTPLSMRELVERGPGLAEANGGDDFKRARDAVFKAHERLRSGLGALIDEKAGAGLISEDDARELHGLRQLLYRCQRRPGNRVQGDGGDHG